MDLVVMVVMEENMVLGLSMDSEVMEEALATEDTAVVVMAVMEETLAGEEALVTEDTALVVMVVMTVLEEDMVSGLSTDSEVMVEALAGEEALATEVMVLVVMAVMEEALVMDVAMDTVIMA